MIKNLNKFHKSTDIDLTTGNEYGVLIRFTLPILIGNLFQQLYGVADSVIVGRVLGEASLAAVGASYHISNIILTIAMGLTLGISILISQFYGSKEYERIQIAVDTGSIVTIVLATVITFFGCLRCEALISLFHVPEDIKKEAVLYLKIVLMGTIPSFGYNAITNFLRGVGDSKSPLYFLMISSIVNILLDILLVKTFSLGVAGAAIATVIAESICYIVLIIYVNRSSMKFKIRFQKLKADRRVLWVGLKIGVPAMLQQLFISFGSSVIQIMINDFGTTVISAYTAASKIDGFAMMPAANLGKAMSNYVAQNVGAGEAGRIKKGMRAGLYLIGGSSAIITVLIYTLSEELMKLFCDSTIVNVAGTGYLRIVSLFYIIFGAMQMINGVLIGRGKAMISMLATVGSFVLLQVPVAILLSRTIGVIGIWIAAPIGWIGGFLLRYLYYRKITK